MIDPATGGKHYSVAADGRVGKRTVGHLNAGHAFVESVPDMTAFAEVLNTRLVPGKDILTYGIPLNAIPEAGIPLFSRKRRRGEDAERAITRTSSDLAWPKGPGIFAADYDPDGGARLNRAALLEQLFDVVPGLDGCDVIWGCSSSSFIYKGDRKRTGLKGQRIYFAAQDGRDIARAGDVLLKRFWLAGHGRIMVSASGHMLVRGTFDPCMYQPERIDYAAGAVCGKGLEQRRPPAQLVSTGEVLVDTQTVLPPLSHAEEAAYVEMVDAAKRAAEPAAAAQRAVWAEVQLARKARLDAGEHASERAVERRIEALRAEGYKDVLLKRASEDTTVLPFDHLIRLRNGKFVSAQAIVENPGRYHGMSTADPLEPDYGGGRQTGKIFTDRTPLIVSQAHGIQKTYTLGTEEEKRELHGRLWSEFSKIMKEAKNG